MSSNITNAATIAYFRWVTSELNRYIPITFLVLGIIGNLINLMIFSRPILRGNSCSNYFISGSVANLISLFVGLLTPFLALYNLDPTQIHPALCKIRLYLRFVTITLSTWFILFACVDRYCCTSTNVNLRRWSSVRVSRRVIAFSTLFALFVPYVQVFFCVDINHRRVCTFSSDICKATIDGVLLLCNSGFPPLLIVLLTALTIQNVRHSRQVRSRYRRNVQLIRILCIQVIILVFFAAPITTQKIYGLIARAASNDPYANALNNLINQVSTELSYIHNAITFYVYSLTTKRFRKEVWSLLVSPKKSTKIYPS